VARLCLRRSAAWFRVSGLEHHWNKAPDFRPSSQVWQRCSRFLGTADGCAGATDEGAAQPLITAGLYRTLIGAEQSDMPQEFLVRIAPAAPAMLPTASALPAKL